MTTLNQRASEPTSTEAKTIARKIGMICSLGVRTWIRRTRLTKGGIYCLLLGTFGVLNCLSLLAIGIGNSTVFIIVMLACAVVGIIGYVVMRAEDSTIELGWKRAVTVTKFAVLGFLSAGFVTSIPILSAPYSSRASNVTKTTQAVAPRHATANSVARQAATENNGTAAKAEKTKSMREQLFQISAGGYLATLLDVDFCQRESERIAKCMVSAKTSQTISSHQIVANASRWDRGRQEWIGLPPAIVNSGFIGRGLSEITIIMPEGTDSVHLLHR
jgi:hypothetical protein